MRTRGRGRGRGRGGLRKNVNSIGSPTKVWQRGDIIWAKVKRWRWWPAVVLDEEDCGKIKGAVDRRLDHVVFWYGHNTVGSVARSQMVDFKENFQKFYDKDARALLVMGAHLAILHLAAFMNYPTKTWTIEIAVNWAKNNFPPPEGWIGSETAGVLSPFVERKLSALRLRANGGRIDTATRQGKLLVSLHKGTTDPETVCLSCVDPLAPEPTTKHPLFKGNLCRNCKIQFLKKSFSMGLDMVEIHCCVCLREGLLVYCSMESCYRSFCKECINWKAKEIAAEKIDALQDWYCFLCVPDPKLQGLLIPRSDWKRNVWQLYHGDSFDLQEFRNMPLRVLCLKNSASTAVPVLSLLQKHGISVETLFLKGFHSYDIKQILPFLVNGVQVNLLTKKDTLWGSDDINGRALRNLARVSPHIIIGHCKGSKTAAKVVENFALFFELITLTKNCFVARFKPPKIPVMWVYAVSEPSSFKSTIHISRFLQFDPARWSKQTLKKLKGRSSCSKDNVWTNLPLLWSALDAEGK